MIDAVTGAVFARSWKALPVNTMTTEAFEFVLFTVKRVIATDPII